MSTRIALRAAVAVAATLTLAALPADAAGADVVFKFDFRHDAQGWTGGFADYPDSGDDTDFELGTGWAKLPRSLSKRYGGYRTAGHNRSDDLFMFAKRRIEGLEPSTTYELRFDVRFATIAQPGSIGIGGSPGDSVYVKAGASAVEPVATSVDAFWTMNVDKGVQSEGGADAIVLGTVGAGPRKGPVKWRIKRLRSARDTFQATTAGDGSLWVFVGTDSGYEGFTELWYTRLKVRATPSEQ